MWLESMNWRLLCHYFLVYCLATLLEVGGKLSCLVHFSVTRRFLIFFVLWISVNSQVQYTLSEMCWSLRTTEYRTEKCFPCDLCNPLIVLVAFSLGGILTPAHATIDEEAFPLWTALLVFLGKCQGCCYYYDGCVHCYSPYFLGFLILFYTYGMCLKWSFVLRTPANVMLVVEQNQSVCPPVFLYFKCLFSTFFLGKIFTRGSN